MVVVLLSTAAFAAAPVPKVTMTGYDHFYEYPCTGDAVNVRSGPSTAYVSFGFLNRNETFWHQPGASRDGFSYGKCSENSNISVAYNCSCVYGWISSKYIGSSSYF